MYICKYYCFNSVRDIKMKILRQIVLTTIG